MCSNRWAKPVRPGRSFFEPTWYQTFTATIGVEWSSCRITCRPLGSVYFSNGTAGSGAAARAAEENTSGIIRFRGANRRMTLPPEGAIVGQAGKDRRIHNCRLSLRGCESIEIARQQPQPAVLNALLATQVLVHDSSGPLIDSQPLRESSATFAERKATICQYSGARPAVEWPRRAGFQPARLWDDLKSRPTKGPIEARRASEMKKGTLLCGVRLRSRGQVFDADNVQGSRKRDAASLWGGPTAFPLRFPSPLLHWAPGPRSSRYGRNPAGAVAFLRQCGRGHSCTWPPNGRGSPAFRRLDQEPSSLSNNSCGVQMTGGR